MSDEKKIRLLPQEEEAPEDLARRIEHQQRAENLQRESELENSVAPYRIGSVPYLNAVPLTRGIEDQIVFETPSRLAKMLQNDELDAALVSVVEVLSNDRYDILDGISIASLNEVKSVLLAHRRPLDEIDVVYCDSASLTSVSLLKVLLLEQGLKPRFEPFEDYSSADRLDYVLLIGDQALDFLYYKKSHLIWDLGAAWYELTKLPFVYAVWAIRRGVKNPERLHRILREAHDFGMDTIDYIISNRTEYDYDFRKDYLTWNIHYHLGADERRGINRFIELLEKHNICKVYPPRYV
ncbi:MAG: menaquinone biosynthetic enzyme MqnA/MqnD family protein [Verrucomicrobiia bacterium]|jgi:chorismate dehydratase